MNSDSIPGRLRDPRALALVVLALIALVLPMFLGQYYTNLLVTVMVLGLFALSFNLLFGYTGLLSFGQAAYFGVAAYSFAIIRAGQIEMVPELSVVLAAIVAVIVAGVVAAAFGVICVQRGEIYFAMLTLALSMMLYQAANQWSDISGGDDGLIVSAPPIKVGGFAISVLDVVTKYYITFAVLLASIAVIWRVIHSSYGALLIAIRENPQRAELIGVPVKRYQLSSFVIAGTFSGIAGVLYSIHNFVVTTNILHWSTSAEPILMTLLGGPSSFFGPLLGAFLWTLLEQVLTNITVYWQIGLGLILIPLVLFVPGGVMSLLEKLTAKGLLVIDDRQTSETTGETGENDD